MKKWKLLLASAVMTLGISATAFAGQWVQNSTGWWYDYGNGTWPANSWQWIDGNNDGVAECYYFDMYGYMLANTTTPDSYQVNESGAWTINGVVQTRSTAGTPVNNSGDNSPQGNTNVQAVDLWDMEPVADNFYSKQKNVRTSQNALWGKALRLNYGNSYAEFYVGGQYNTLSMIVAPQKGFSESGDYTLEIYGDDDNLLDYTDINYKTAPKDFSVDISGQEYVKIYLLRNDGSSGAVIMKNAQFR